jgi:hypothetical protein
MLSTWISRSTHMGKWAFHVGWPKNRYYTSNPVVVPLSRPLVPTALPSPERDFFAAGVWHDQWGVIPRETCPLPRDAPSQALAAQARDQLKFPVADPYAVDGRLGDVWIDKVNVPPIAGPVRIIRRTAYQFCPLVSAEVEQHQFRRI